MKPRNLIPSPRTALGVVWTAVLLTACFAQAQDSDAPLASPSGKALRQRPKAAPTTTPTPGKEPSLDFELLNEPPPVDKALQAHQTVQVEKEVKARRQMLLAHQALGIATLVTLAATDIVGQLNFNDKYGGGGDTAHYQLLHIGLATGTLAFFSSAALLGVFAPTPYPKHFQFDSAGFHKIFMGIATAGMVAQVVLGILMSTHEGQLNQRTFATLHQVSGYASLGATAAGVTALIF